MRSLSRLTDEALHLTIKSITGQERRATAEIVLHLAEIDSRGIYRDLGYSSLFVYCREALGYSEGASHRRVQAARCLRSSPEIYDLIREGKVTLSALAEVTKVMTPKNRTEILARTEGASKREAEKIAADFGAPSKPRRERVTVRKVAKTAPETQSDLFHRDVTSEPEVRYSYAFEADAEFQKLYEEAREITGPVPMAEIMKRALRAIVRSRRPKQARQSVTSKITSPAKPKGNSKARSRVIAAPVRRAVFERDGRRCTFVSKDGRRCTERHGLQLDHVRPFGMGGGNEESNLRLLCPAHNQLHAERVYGREKMNRFEARAR